MGASVVVAGSTVGTATDENGKFELSNVSSNATLQISFIGYVTQNVAVSGRTNFSVTLKEDAAQLDEVVVVGYGMEQKRVKMTNSISKVEPKALTTGSYANPAQALAGAVSGVKVFETSGSPSATPTIIIRGGTGLDYSGSPLVIVDGQIRGSLSDINPNDIASMEILKDAGATALYGARASNGVILVSTKSGQKGSAQINFNTKIGLRYAVEAYDYANAHDYIYWMRMAYTPEVTPWNQNILPGYLTGNNQPIGIGRTEIGPGMVWNIMTKTDENAYLLQKGWQEMIDPVTGVPIIYKDTDVAGYNSNMPAVSQEYNLSMSGGNDRGKYYVGLGYYNAEGTPVTTFYKRYTMAFTGSYKITNWLESSTVFNYIRANWLNMPANSNGDAGNFFGRLASAPPTLRMEDEDGNLLMGKDGADINYLFQPEKFKRDNQSDKFSMSETLTATLCKGLTLKGSMMWYYNEQLAESYNDAYRTTGANESMNTSRAASASFLRYFDQTYNVVLNYRTSIHDTHNISAMAGIEYYDRQYRDLSASGSGSEVDGLYSLDYTYNGSVSEQKASTRNIGSSHEESRIFSAFARVEYDYKEKYLLAATFREDGYSSLIDNRWGAFPGVSAGWVFSKEDFVSDALPWLSYGKVRASFGLNGNASGIGAYTLQGQYGSYKYNGSTGFRISSLPNPGLRWEKTRTAETGFDLGFLTNRINFGFTFYDRLTSDKYAALRLPQTTGFSSVTNNNGKIRNRGVELELSATLLKRGDFRWDLSANMTYNKNTIVKLPDNDLLRNRQSAVELYTGRTLPDGTYETDWFGGYQEGMEPGNDVIVYQVDYMVRDESQMPKNYVALRLNRPMPCNCVRATSYGRISTATASSTRKTA